MKLFSTLTLQLIGYLGFSQDKVKRIDGLLNALYSKGKLNGNVLVAEKGKGIYSQSFGLANETTRANLNEGSIFNTASASKQFTAMAIMVLKEKGKLKLDDAVKLYIPELKMYYQILLSCR